MASVLATIEEKYSYDDEKDDYGFIVFVCNSPETKKGMLPPMMTLCDSDIETLGSSSLPLSKFSHIAELDLTDNLISDWNEVFLLLNTLPKLEFLNLSNNMLNEPLDLVENQQTEMSLVMKKFVLNGNNVEWRTVNLLGGKMPQLEQLYLSTNNLYNPQGDDNVFQHQNLSQLFLTCNPLTDFEVISENVKCPNLELLSLAQCPISFIPDYQAGKQVLGKLGSLNLTTTKIDSWEQIDKLRMFPALKELRFQHCPVLNGLTKHEKRMMVIARLPKVKILNGGDPIPAKEREDAERAFIRYFMDSEKKPARYHELIDIHGQLDPLVNISMRPDTHVSVSICHKDANREETIEVYQSVQQFKTLLQKWFKVPPQNMKLYYCDKDLVELAGPEEMKWPQKALYTYNVQNGDKFILDEKVASLGKKRTIATSNSSSLAHSPGSPRLHNSSGSRSKTSTISPCTFSFMMNPKMFSSSKNSKVTKNLFGHKQTSSRVPKNIICPGEEKTRKSKNEMMNHQA